MVRTSPSQFEFMVDFMERNGDLNKPAGEDGPSGRIRAILKWQELCEALDIDKTGTAKSVDKWKKVWSDLKNNTKRKAARINSSAEGTGGGPACSRTLTEMEKRLMRLLEPRVASGLVSKREQAGPSQIFTPTATMDSHDHDGSDTMSPTPSLRLVQIKNIVEDEWKMPGESSYSTPFPAEVVDVELTTSPTAHYAQSPRYRAPRRERRGRHLRSHSLTASALRRHLDACLSNDQHWRNLATQFVTETMRLREIELQQQAQWQTLFAKLIELLNTINNK